MIGFSCYHFATQLGSTHEKYGGTQLERGRYCFNSNRYIFHALKVA
jgi:hypothetical protein